ncbi:MAG: YciI family protein [Candidatus Dormiibacterota bacterium]
MPQYLLTIHQPDGPPPPGVLEAVLPKLEVWNRELRAADAWVFSGGLQPASVATVVRVRDGDELMTDGPYVEGKEHVGGFVVVRAPDLGAAIQWGRKLARALAPLAIEVRPFGDEIGGG